MNVANKYDHSQPAGYAYQNTDEQKNYRVQPETPAKEERRATTKKAAFSFSLKGFLMSIAIILIVTMASTQLIMQYQMSQVDEHITQYKLSTEELELESDFLMGKVLDQYDYEVIKEAAEQQGMTIDGQRVKELTHE